MLRVLRNRIGHQLAYYRLCERTHGREYKILEWAGMRQPVPVIISQSNQNENHSG